MEVVDVPGATGYLDTNYQGKVDAALNALQEKDLAFLHVEAPDEAAHSGQRDLKIKAIEDFDKKVVGPALEGLAAFPRWRVLLTPDHRTPITTRVHSAEPVPFILLDSDQWKASATIPKRPFTEETATAAGTMVEDASKLIEILLERQKL